MGRRNGKGSGNGPIRILPDALGKPTHAACVAGEMANILHKNLPRSSASSSVRIRLYDHWRRDLREAFKKAKKRGKASRQSPPVGSPYPGLRAFRSEEAGVFFGRENQAEKLVGLLHGQAVQFVAVVGASGTGKSSLIYAGVLPSLQNAQRHWPVLAFTPGYASENPFTALATEIVAQLSTARVGTPAELARKLAAKPDTLTDYAGQILAGSPDDAALILFIDQFEELFRDTSLEHRSGFTNLVVKAAQLPRLRVVITLRADFFQQFMAEADFADLAQRGAVFPMGPPKVSELRRMIQNPAQKAGIPFDDELADKLLEDAGPNPGEALPLIAFCLDELHRLTGPGHGLVLDTYSKMGGLRAAIGRRVSELLTTIEDVKGDEIEGILSQIFHVLVHVDASGNAVRKWAYLDALTSMSHPVPTIIENLIKGRLLFAGESEKRASVALSHEALLQEWPALPFLA